MEESRGLRWRWQGLEDCFKGEESQVRDMAVGASGELF